MVDHDQFNQDAMQLLKFMAGDEVDNVRDILLEMSGFDAGRKLLSVPAIAGAENVPDDDWKNLCSLIGGEFLRDVLWIPKFVPPPEVVTPIVAAAREKNFAEVNRMIEAGTDVRTEDSEGEVIQHLVNLIGNTGPADRGEALRWLRLLLESDLRVNDHALAESAKYLINADLRLVLMRNGNPNARDHYGIPAIQHAVKSFVDAFENVRLLIESGANPNLQQRSADGFTSDYGVLDECIRRDLFDLAEYLVNHGIEASTVELAFLKARSKKRDDARARWLQLLEPYFPRENNE